MLSFFEKLFYTLVGGFKILRGSTCKPDILKVKATQKSCYILGNGPSLNQDIEGNIDFLRTQDLVAVNFFGNTDLFLELRPQYYVWADPIFFINNANPKTNELVDSIIKTFIEKTNWTMNLLVPCYGEKIIKEKLKTNPHIIVSGYNNISCRKAFRWFDRWVHDKQWAIFSGMNVVIVATYLSVVIGFKEINLIGVDHSWHKNFIVGDDNRIYLEDPHFYDKSKVKANPVANNIENGKPYTLHDLLYCSVIVFETYHSIEKYAKNKHVNIYNCCSGSFIDAFERKKITHEDQ